MRLIIFLDLIYAALLLFHMSPLCLSHPQRRELTKISSGDLDDELPITEQLCDPICVLELELELIQTQMAQKPMLRAEVGMRVRCANKASAE